MFKRTIRLPRPGTETFFIWGPRQTGKTTLLKTAYPDAKWIDLLKADEFRRYLERPESLREEVFADDSVRFVVVDEVQKVPQLLDEVHWLMENHPEVKKRLVVCLESKERKTEDGILVCPYRQFTESLWAGDIF